MTGETYPEADEMNLVPPSNEILNQVAERVLLHEIESDEVQGLIDNMLDIASGEQGNAAKPTMVGLAAPQLGVSKRILLLGTNAAGQGEIPEFLAMINPVIIKRSERSNMNREGCYSTGQVCGVVERSTWVTVEALDRFGKPMHATFDDFVARVLQHEIDHLDGIRFPDRIPDDRKLLWVEPDQFGKFRLEWDKWDVTCSRERWQAIKSGQELA